MMIEGEYKKLQVKIGEKAYTYRGKIIAISDDKQFLTLQDVKCGSIRIKISEIIIEEPYENNGGNR